MKETAAAQHAGPRGADGASRLLVLVGRSAPPHRPVGGLLHRWHAASDTSLHFDEWADPASTDLADVFAGSPDLATVEQAVVAFAQARAGADHDVDAVAADLVALVRLAWPTGHGTWGDAVDPIGLVARALGAWAVEHTTAASCGDCRDAVTGLTTAHYLRERVRELHDQCRALAISPPLTFGGVVVQLDLASAAATERIGVRVTAGRLLAARFRGGETVSALSPTRMVAVMSAYGIDRAVRDVASDLAALGAVDGVDVRISRVAFADDAAGTFGSLMGAAVGSWTGGPTV